MNKSYIIYAIALSVAFVSFDLKAQELQVYINQALTHNPEIQQFEIKHQRISEKQQEANSLPNTEIGVGVFASSPETRTGAQKFKVSVKQMLPFFGTITARENYAASLADIAYQDIVVKKRKLIAEVSQSYYKLYKIKAKQAVLEENIELLSTYEKLALTSVEVGKASAVDVLKLQIRQNELTQKKEVLKEQFLGEQASFNKLLNREVLEPVMLVDSLQMPDKTESFNSEDLKLHPELIKFDRLYTSVEKSEIVNQKQSKPMLGFGIDYVNVEKRPNMSFSDNGKDIVMPMVSVSIPIFNKKYKSLSKQHSLQQEEVLTQKQQRLNSLEAKLQNVVSLRNAAFINYKTQQKNLIQAKNAQNILVKSYETGTIDFNDVLDIQELQLKFQMNMISSKLSYYNQSVALHYLTAQN
ncbi:transporter [Tenacibaculum holothuriorum]|uniref:Transporter n=1 Tax=Tenacibaculum holothuriorum TaxID=1635173 RepID=A0A1Y2PFT6_9FLAO|nr:TolC family protein [Tenacibaculum holothuriorum]OSY89295.1 transporter [Tenacibaculum holothuriorum]